MNLASCLLDAWTIFSRPPKIFFMSSLLPTVNYPSQITTIDLSKLLLTRNPKQHIFVCNVGYLSRIELAARNAPVISVSTSNVTSVSNVSHRLSNTIYCEDIWRSIGLTCSPCCLISHQCNQLGRFAFVVCGLTYLLGFCQEVDSRQRQPDCPTGGCRQPAVLKVYKRARYRIALDQYANSNE